MTNTNFAFNIEISEKVWNYCDVIYKKHSPHVHINPFESMLARVIEDDESGELYYTNFVPVELPYYVD